MDDGSGYVVGQLVAGVVISLIMASMGLTILHVFIAVWGVLFVVWLWDWFKNL